MKANFAEKTTLNSTLESKLFAYAAAAAATGFTVLSATMPAQAEIVYTPANSQLGPTLYIDLNHDGINDFELVLKHSSHCQGLCTVTTNRHFNHKTAFNSQHGTLAVYGLNGNEVFGQGTSASALPNNFQIGSNGKFPGGNNMLRANDINSYTFDLGLAGPWKGKSFGVSSLNNRYIGFKFSINGETHFGWARLNVSVARGATITATLTGYAYETVANKAITTLGFTIAGDRNPMWSAEQTASLEGDSNVPTLGLLALGAPAVDGWRNRELAISK